MRSPASSGQIHPDRPESGAMGAAFNRSREEMFEGFLRLVAGEACTWL